METELVNLGKPAGIFLGHGVGLQVDETPVIANNFRDPVYEGHEGMVFAIDPK